MFDLFLPPVKAVNSMRPVLRQEQETSTAVTSWRYHVSFSTWVHHMTPHESYPLPALTHRLTPTCTEIFFDTAVGKCVHSLTILSTYGPMFCPHTSYASLCCVPLLNAVQVATGLRSCVLCTPMQCTLEWAMPTGHPCLLPVGLTQWLSLTSQITHADRMLVVSYCCRKVQLTC